MATLIFLLAISPVICSFVGFLAGARGDRALRQHLADFYVAAQGDWANIYRCPAALVTQYLSTTFGRTPLLFPPYIAFFSLITTALLTMAHLNLTIPQGVDSVGPILSGEGRFNWGLLWSFYLAPNLIGDLICWPLSLFLFAKLSRSKLQRLSYAQS